MASAVPSLALTPETWVTILTRAAAGETLTDLGAEYGVHPATISKKRQAQHLHYDLPPAIRKRSGPVPGRKGALPSERPATGSPSIPRSVREAATAHVMAAETWADGDDEGAPVWRGHALHRAFLAGVSWQRQREAGGSE